LYLRKREEYSSSKQNVCSLIIKDAKEENRWIDQGKNENAMMIENSFLRLSEGICVINYI
jgi:hypothetical protein